MTMTILGLSELYASQFARLRRVGDSRAGDPTEAEAIVQDAFLRLIEAGTAPRGAGLLVRIVRNLAIDGVRRRRRRDAALKTLGEGVETITPEAVLAARQDLRDLVRLIEGMPERQRRILLLVRLDGLPQAHVARRLGVSLSTVEKDLAAALGECLDWRRRREEGP